jgi:hypothetical protein
LSSFGLLFGPKLLVNAGTLAPSVARWLPKFHGIPFFFFFFSALGPIQGHKVQHLLVTWGQIQKFFFFSISALSPSVKKALGADFKLLLQ